MCGTWRHPSRPDEEFVPALLDKLPANLDFVNVTGGEPFLRADIGEIVGKALSKSKRLVISSNGYFTDRIVELFEHFGNRIGIRVSIEGLQATNDELRGIRDGYDRGLRTLAELRRMGIRDIGFGVTIADRNADDAIALYRMAAALKMEFATATTHNSFYFHTQGNQYRDREKVALAFEGVAVELLKSSRPKNWFRAYFTMGLARKARGLSRALPCEVGTDLFFVDPSGDVLPCNGSDRPLVMGNLKHQDFDPLWHGPRAREVRALVARCRKQCWMIGSAAPAMKKRIAAPLAWVARNKARLLLARDRPCRLRQIGC